MKCCGVLLYLSSTDSDHNLKLTTNQTAVCLGDYYYLLCASQEPFGRMCKTSTVDWHNSTDERVENDTTHLKLPKNATVAVLKILITEDEFSEPQTFYCKATTHMSTCMSNVLLVGRYGEFKSGTHVYSRIVFCAAGMHEAQLYTTHGLMLHAVKSYIEILHILCSICSRYNLCLRDAGSIYIYIYIII